MYKNNEILCDTLGVKVFPCFHVYAGCQGLLCSLDAHENDYHHIMNDLRDELNRLLESREATLQNNNDGDAGEYEECILSDAEDALGQLKDAVSGYGGAISNNGETSRENASN